MSGRNLYRILTFNEWVRLHRMEDVPRSKAFSEYCEEKERMIDVARMKTTKEYLPSGVPGIEQPGGQYILGEDN